MLLCMLVAQRNAHFYIRACMQPYCVLAALSSHAPHHPQALLHTIAVHPVQQQPMLSGAARTCFLKSLANKFARRLGEASGPSSCSRVCSSSGLISNLLLLKRACTA